MSVTETINLPAQPTTGTVRYGPMGGDGWTAPLARYEIEASLDMDGSGGTWRIAINMDPQFMSVVALMGLLTDQGSDTIAFSMDCRLDAANVQYRVAGDLKQLHSTNAQALWALPPIIDPVAIDFRLVNTDTFDGIGTCTIYLFKKSAQHVVPINVIMSCLPRSGSVM